MLFLWFFGFGYKVIWNGRGEVSFAQRAREELWRENPFLTITATQLGRELSDGSSTEIQGWRTWAGQWGCTEVHGWQRWGAWCGVYIQDTPGLIDPIFVNLLYKELHNLSLLTVDLTCSVRDFMDPHNRGVSYILTLFLCCSSWNPSFTWIPVGCHERFGAVLMMGSLSSSSAISPHRHWQQLIHRRWWWGGGRRVPGVCFQQGLLWWFRSSSRPGSSGCFERLMIWSWIDQVPEKFVQLYPWIPPVHLRVGHLLVWHLVDSIAHQYGPQATGYKLPRGRDVHLDKRRGISVCWSSHVEEGISSSSSQSSFSLSSPIDWLVAFDLATALLLDLGVILVAISKLMDEVYWKNCRKGRRRRGECPAECTRHSICIKLESWYTTCVSDSLVKFCYTRIFI